MNTMHEYLSPTEVIDCDEPSIREKALEITRGLQTPKEKAVAIFYAVRDGIKHNPYAPAQALEDHKASVTLARGSGQCQHKSAVLVALCRAAGIPARVGYVDVRDHQLSDKFRNMIGGDNLLIQHGYAEVYVDGKWLHVSPAYGRDTCEKGGFVPVEFDGEHDAKDSLLNVEGRPHMEHVKDHGTFADFPWDFIVEYRKQWVAGMGRGWEEYTENVRDHNVE
jgi:transglutaminase-like putative cysteine protease